MKRMLPAAGRAPAAMVLVSALLAVASCAETPVAPAAPETDVAAVPAPTHPEISPPRFQSGSLGGCEVVSDPTEFRGAVAPSTLCLVRRTETDTYVRITFEGRSNHAPVGTIANTTFPAWMTLRAKSVGGTGNTYDEPSGVTSIFWSFPGQLPSRAPSTRDILLERPVYELELYFAAAVELDGATPFDPSPHLPDFKVTLVAKDSVGALLTSAQGDENYNMGSAPDPEWVFNEWDPLTVTSPVAPGGDLDNRIGKVTINGFEDFIGVDDVYLRIINFRPRAAAGGPYSAPQGTSISFDGGGSYDPVDAAGRDLPTGDQLTYEWTFTDEVAGEVVGSAPDSMPSFTFFRPGEHTARLIVTDPNGWADTVTVTPSISNVAPAIHSAPTSVSLFIGESYELPITFTDPGIHDGPWTYTIDWGDGRVATGSVASHSAPMTMELEDRTHTYRTPGPHTITITVTDRWGDSDERTVAVTTSQPTAVLAGPQTGPEGSTLVFSASGSENSEGSDVGLAYLWTVRIGETSGSAGSGSELSYAFPDDGVYTVELRVTESSGAWADASMDVTITNVAPTADFNAPGTATVGASFGLSLTNPFDPSPVDVAAGFTYEFDCGSGNFVQAAGSAESCTATAAGVLTVRGRISDKDGGSNSYTAEVVVESAPFVEATVEVRPEAIMLNQRGDGTITVFAYSANGFDHHQIVPGTTRLTRNSDGQGGVPVSLRNNGTPNAVINPAQAQFQFSRTELIVSGDLQLTTEVLYLVGELTDGTMFIGHDTVRVLP